MLNKILNSVRYFFKYLIEGNWESTTKYRFNDNREILTKETKFSWLKFFKGGYYLPEKQTHPFWETVGKFGTFMTGYHGIYFCLFVLCMTGTFTFMWFLLSLVALMICTRLQQCYFYKQRIFKLI